jgi:hypothetical protein
VVAEAAIKKQRQGIGENGEKAKEAVPFHCSPPFSIFTMRPDLCHPLSKFGQPVHHGLPEDHHH